MTKKVRKIKSVDSIANRFGMAMDEVDAFYFSPMLNMKAMPPN